MKNFIKTAIAQVFKQFILNFIFRNGENYISILDTKFYFVHIIEVKQVEDIIKEQKIRANVNLLIRLPV